MKSRHWIQYILLTLALTTKILFYLDLMMEAHFGWIRYASILADMVFMGVLLGLLIEQKEQKWLISLAKISLSIFFVKDVFELFYRKILGGGRIALSIVGVIFLISTILYAALYISLFFTRRDGLRSCFRWQGACTLLGLVWGIFILVLTVIHSPLLYTVKATYPVAFLLEYIPLFVGVFLSAKRENISGQDDLLARFPEMQEAGH